MCGIVGAFTFDAFEKKSEEKARTEANIFITTQLLQATVDRGKEATGVSLVWADGNYTGLKMGISSPEFIARFGDTEKDYGGFLKLWREYPKLMKVFIGHCRKSSVGNSFDNKNNHPIQIGDLILVHNGTLTNHEKIFDKLKYKRIGDVDSEAIGHLLHHYTNGGVDPFTPDIIKETSRRLSGTYSVLATSGNNPYQVAQFRDGRPAEMVLVKPLKMVFVASEKKFLEKVLFEYNKMSQLFVTPVKLPFIKKNDVEFKMLQDDSLALWDLTLPVTDETTIEDLFTHEKVPLRVDKIWNTSTTTTTNNNYASKKKPGTEVSASTTGDNSKANAGEDDADGLVWSKSLTKYKSQQGIKKSKIMGSVMVDVEKGEVIVTDKKAGEPAEDLKEVDSEKIENFLVSSAETEELSLKKAAEAVKKSEGDDAPGNTIEVKMEADAEAIKKADEATEKGLIKFENDDEVTADLEVSDPSVLRSLPMYALANRIKKFIWREGFVAGYTARKKEATIKPLLPDDKVMKAEAKIRVLKTVVKLLAHALDIRLNSVKMFTVETIIKEAVMAITKDPSKVRADLSIAFSTGDLKNIPLLKEISKKISK